MAQSRLKISLKAFTALAKVDVPANYIKCRTTPQRRRWLQKKWLRQQTHKGISWQRATETTSQRPARALALHWSGRWRLLNASAAAASFYKPTQHNAGRLLPQNTYIREDRSVPQKCNVTFITYRISRSLEHPYLTNNAHHHRLDHYNILKH